jgi:hypothetical protein
VAESDEALRFIQTDPVLYPIGQSIDHGSRIFREPLRAVPVEPSAAMQEVEREVPVEERYPRNGPSPSTSRS